MWISFNSLYFFYFNHVMNIVIADLSKKQNLQTFLLCMLQCIAQYFKSTSALSEEKTYLAINKLFTKISSEFPLVYSINNLNKKLNQNIKDKINDKSEGSSKKGRKKAIGLKSFMTNLESDKDSTSTEENKELDQQSLLIWIKRVLQEEIAELKEDIKDGESTLETALNQKLQPLQPSSNHQRTIIFFDSFLQNIKFVQALQSYMLKIVVDFESSSQDKDEIKIEDASRYLKNASYLIISCDVVFKNGGVLAKSGGLMLATAAKYYKIPVVAVTRRYCLSDTLIMSQKPLLLSQNSIKYFKEAENFHSEFKVYVGKKFQYIEPKYIDTIMSEEGSWSVQNVTEMFEQYYN